MDGVVDYWFVSVSGSANICNDTLQITNIVLDGAPDPDIVATYVGLASGVYTGSEILSEILFKVMDKIKSE